MRRPAARLALSVCAALAVLTGLPPASLPAAGAQATPAGQTTPAGTVRLLGQTAWVEGQQGFELQLALEASGPVEDLEVAVTVYRRVANRTEFAQTLEGRLRSAGFDQTRLGLTELVAEADGTVRVTIAPLLGREGVYPVRVELREKGGGEVLDGFVTHLVYLPGPVEGERLRAAWVVPVHGPPSLQPDGRTALAPDVGDRLAALAASLEAHPEVPLVVRPTPETLAGLASSEREVDRTTLASFSRLVAGRQVVVGHFVPTNLAGLLGAGLQPEAGAQLSEGVGEVAGAFGTAPDSRTWVSDERLDEAALEHLAAQQYDRLVVPEAALLPTELTTTLTQSFELLGGPRRMRVAAADPGLADHMTGLVSPVLAAHNLLADLAVIYFDRPGRPGSVVVAPPRSWRPTAAFLEAFLVGLAGSPVVAASTLDGVFGAAPPPTLPVLVRRLAPASGSGDLAAGAVRTLRRRLDAFGSVLEPGNSLYRRIERRLLTSQSVDLRPRDRSAYLDGARGEIDAQLGMIEIPAKRSITLTARQGEIPVTISSSTGYPVRGVLRVQSATLEFPQGDRRPLELNRRNTTERVLVEARGSGSFPLRVRLESPDGSLVLAESVFTVRSTAASWVGLSLSIGAAGFLGVWWAGHLRGRRSRRLVPA